MASTRVPRLPATPRLEHHPARRPPLPRSAARRGVGPAAAGDLAALLQALRRRRDRRLCRQIEEASFSRAGWWLAQLARLIGGPLPTGAETGVPMVVTVTEDAASGGQIWTRICARSNGFPQVIHSAKRFAGPTGLEEYVGYGVSMALRISVEHEALVFRSVGYSLQIGPLRAAAAATADARRSHRDPFRSRRRHVPLHARDRSSALRQAHSSVRIVPGGRVMTSLLWILIAIQIVMGVFDTFYHHELTERLAWRPSQRYELQLHSVRNMLYALLFLVLGWLEVHGILAMLIIAVLAAEIVITLMDFVEEDMSRKLPASERINHTLLAINYGAILVLLLPVLIGWADAADRRHIGLHGLAQPGRGGGSRGRRAVRPARFRGVKASCAHDQRARRKPGRKTARTADRAGHRRHRLHRQPPGGRPERGGASGHRAGAQPRESRHAAAADHADHQPRSAPGGHPASTRSSISRASRSATGCGPTPSAARSSTPAST